ncbi:uncharacterized protein LAESUDRAFT_710544 [Laetiporus sulphureus 93-53]|uniref:Uncharacterized protein n=1 Tax=Laetiporus sulphureus 93-53 TaxID=1314785 RepID=A0A165HQB7_9APHY|nr:uncharacterized protein LAESUDRAFT_710544 [Laetiporus sulphureus 93-53]KZT12044.1 hypothetical protein LAESUDRAFT_710544 [Laetiporus sulphureus 93-53]
MSLVACQTEEMRVGCEAGFSSGVGPHTRDGTNARQYRHSDSFPRAAHGSLYPKPSAGATHSIYIRGNALPAGHGKSESSAEQRIYSRAKSEAVMTIKPSRSHGTHRTRSSSSAELSHFTSKQACRPFLTTRVTLPTIAPAILHTPQDELELLGSFTPTSPSRQSLRSLLHSRSSSWAFFEGIGEEDDDGLHHFSPSQNGSSENSPETSPHLPSFTIPSICRTPPSYAGSEYFPTAPSSAGPPTPVGDLSSSPHVRPKALRPSLESLEDTSKFCVQAHCAACKRVGSNFPCCPRCGEMWCSRECRLQGSSGKRHVCRK